MTGAAPTRGERNNNPGNIVQTHPRTAWQGGVPADALTDSRFEQFTEAKWGIRALAYTLLVYHDKHGLNTVRGIIDRWAPPIENDTQQYATLVASRVGVGLDDVIDPYAYTTMRGLVLGIITEEDGCQPYSEDVLLEAFRLCGVTPLVPITNTPQS